MTTELLDTLLLRALRGVEMGIYLVSTIPPEAFWAIGGLLSAVVLAGLWKLARHAGRAARAWVASRLSRVRVRSRGGRSTRARALALAARGTSRVEIARVTGLSRDVVSLLLRAGDDDAGDERPNLPRTARFAA